MSYLNFIGSVSAYGDQKQSLMTGLLSGQTAPLTSSNEFHSAFKVDRPEEVKSQLQAAQMDLEKIIDQMKDQDFPTDGRWGLILASTKGIIDDLVWDSKDANFDTFSPLVKLIENSLPFSISKKLTVSNACTSSHAGIELGQKWLKRNWVDHVFIFAFDQAGPFTLKGFKTLRALSENNCVRPFDENRDGLILGDGSAGCIISSKPAPKSLWIDPVSSVCEGVSATRPDTTGTHLKKCYQRSSRETPDIILTHGTGTLYNDSTESKAIQRFLANQDDPLVTCSKWGIGHTLGASGLMDLSLAQQMIEQSQVPGIATLENSDLEIDHRLLRSPVEKSVKSVLISSLGFGGLCSAMSLREVPQ